MTATDARSHCDRSTIASVVRNGAPAGDIARWNPTCRADWRERHLGDIYAGSVGREARSDVQIRCSIDGTRYLLLSHVLRHSDTRTGDRTSGHVGSRPLSVCNTSYKAARTRDHMRFSGHARGLTREMRLTYHSDLVLLWVLSEFHAPTRPLTTTLSSSLQSTFTPVLG